MRITKRLIRSFPAFYGLSYFDRRAAEYKRSLGCRKFNKPLCWGCNDFELVTKKCSKYDAKNTCSYWNNVEFKGMTEIELNG